jgi:hypothetical protein
MDASDFKILELIAKGSTLPGKTVNVEPEDVMKELGLERKEYEKKLISLKKSGHLLVYTGLVAGITKEGLDALKEKQAV